MPTVTTVSSEYNGKVAGQIFRKCFNESTTLRLNLLTKRENVNYKTHLRKIMTTNGIVRYVCGHTPAGAIDLSNKTIEPIKFKDDFEICKEDFRQTWSEDLEGASAHNRNAPRDIMEAIIADKLAQYGEKIDSDIWNGDATIDTEFDGLLTQFALDADIIKDGNGLTASGVAVTEATVETELKTALLAIPKAMRKKKLVVGVSSNVFQAYQFYLISKGIANDGTADEKQVKFGKYMLTEICELPDNTIVIYNPENVVFATGLVSDHNQISLVDEDSIGLLTGLVRGKFVYNAGVGYANSEEIVWYVSA